MAEHPLYLIDTNVVSKARKKAKANSGVIRFFQCVATAKLPVYLSSVSVGELRRGIELVRRRRDVDRATRLEAWLETILHRFEKHILAFDADAAQVWAA